MSRPVAASEGVAPTLLETPWSPRPQDKLGFFACSANGGRIVRIGLLGEPGRRPPRALILECPACGLRHQAEPVWRSPTERDEGIEPAIVIDASEAETLGGEVGPMGMRDCTGSR